MPKSKNRKGHKEKVRKRRKRREHEGNRRKKLVKKELKEFHDFMQERMKSVGVDNFTHETKASNVSDLETQLKQRMNSKSKKSNNEEE